MKLIIAGSRTMDVGEAMVSYAVIFFGLKPTEIVSGCCRSGVDPSGEEYARKRDIPIKGFPADWKKNGKTAGPMRNRDMADYADALLIIWDGESRGSANMAMHARMARIPVYEIALKEWKPNDG